MNKQILLLSYVLLVCKDTISTTTNQQNEFIRRKIINYILYPIIFNYTTTL